MALHLTLFRKKYPLYKYAVVGLVTAGVAIFTVYHPSTINKRVKAGEAGTTPASPLTEGDVRDAKEGGSIIDQRNTIWGLFLLGVNLLFDGLTNSTQDYIFQRYEGFTGPQMMCIQNLLNTGLTLSYLFGGPWLAQFRVVKWLGVDLGSAAGGSIGGGGKGGLRSLLSIDWWRSLGGGEFHDAIGFLKRHPAVTRDVLSFAVCGAVGQIFICEFAFPPLLSLVCFAFSSPASVLSLAPSLKPDIPSTASLLLPKPKPDQFYRPPTLLP